MNGALRLVAGCGLGLAACLLLGGCGGGGAKGVRVRGKLLLKGQPYQAKLNKPNMPPGEGMGMVSVNFIPVAGDSELIVDSNGDNKFKDCFPAAVQSDGTFEVPGHQNKGIPKGKYRVVIKHLDPSTEKDMLKNKYNELNSKINRDVESDTEIQIDLDKPSG